MKLKVLWKKIVDSLIQDSWKTCDELVYRFKLQVYLSRARPVQDKIYQVLRKFEKRVHYGKTWDVWFVIYISSYEINGKIFEPKNEKSFETTGVLPLHTYTVKLGFKELLNKEQIGNSKPFPPICQFTW